MEWCVAELPERPVPGVMFGAQEPASLFVSTDGERWDWVHTARRSTPVGRVVEWPVVEVRGGELESVKDTRRHNLLWVDGEALSFRVAELVGPGEYRLGGFERGLRGTEERLHGEGAAVMLLTRASFVAVDWRLVGRAAQWKAAAEYAELGACIAQPYTLGGLTFPRVDGSRPSVVARAARPPSDPAWGARYIVRHGEGPWLGLDGALFVWLDGWVREPVEPGATVYDEDEGHRSYWSGRTWCAC